MKIELKTSDGKSIGEAIKDIVSEELERFDDADVKLAAAEGIREAIAEHWSNRFPGSSHWDATLVEAHPDGTVTVGVAGAGRAYHDVDICPINAEHLTIPVHPEAKGRPASTFANLFRPKGKNVLAANENGSLVVYYALAKEAHQKQDESIMPTDAQMLDKAVERVKEIL